MAFSIRELLASWREVEFPAPCPTPGTLHREQIRTVTDDRLVMLDAEATRNIVETVEETETEEGIPLRVTREKTRRQDEDD